jgi:hypothetical protein
MYKYTYLYIYIYIYLYVYIAFALKQEQLKKLAEMNGEAPPSSSSMQVCISKENAVLYPGLLVFFNTKRVLKNTVGNRYS